MNELETFRLARKGDKEAKEKIVSDNAGLVWSIARRFFGRGYDLEDIYQIGCIGLLKAIERFSEEYEVKFSTYAVPLIAGEIKRFLRDNGMIKVSRILKQNGYKISQAREELSIKLGRDPSMDEISAATGLTDEEIVMATDANKEIESIYQPVYEHDGSEMCLVDKLSDETESEKTEETLYNKMLIEQAMKRLDEKEQKLINLRYFQDKTQSETAKELGISQVQVSRLEKKLLFIMRNSIDNKSNL
ncbi:MAG: SigF/SigG family RNA polymerase sporulation sigma factor [Lachnospiraceae bacterium]|nr:SigF/SigG family RNA polymerase sporulation sigma factor [Lachnospiraceae bacterium]MBQ9233931.1 SigF/SigG family RNA polymerase sporulation sigma factor [Lachnospiraceae bacterium]